jgi:hypothetical protein
MAISKMTAMSSMPAITRSRPWQRAQPWISIAVPESSSATSEPPADAERRRRRLVVGAHATGRRSLAVHRHLARARVANPGVQEPPLADLKTRTGEQLYAEAVAAKLPEGSEPPSASRTPSWSTDG